ncbi:MAG: anti-sigma factor [Acidimicrobiia bacterium]
MDERLNPEELRELLGVFALGAVDDDEREQVEAFVLEDLDARAELHQLEHAVAWINHASPRPSAASWDALHAEMQQDLALDAASTPERNEPDTPVRGSSDREPADNVVALDAFTSKRPTNAWRRLVAVAAAVVIVVGTAIGIGSVILKDSGSPARNVALKAPDGRIAVVVRVESNGNGTIRTASLPAPAPGHIYQLWSQPSATSPMRSAGLLGRSPSGQTFHIPSHADRLAISEEPAGGSHEPTTNPVAVSAVGAV